MLGKTCSLAKLVRQWCNCHPGSGRGKCNNYTPKIGIISGAWSVSYLRHIITRDHVLVNVLVMILWWYKLHHPWSIWAMRTLSIQWFIYILLLIYNRHNINETTIPSSSFAHNSLPPLFKLPAFLSQLLIHSL